MLRSQRCPHACDHLNVLGIFVSVQAHVMLPEMAPMTVKISVGLDFFCFSLGTCCAPKDGPHDCDHFNVLGISCQRCHCIIVLTQVLGSPPWGSVESSWRNQAGRH